MHISLAAEKIFFASFLPITNSLLISIFVSLLLIGLGLGLKNQLKPIPSHLQNLIEAIIEIFLDLYESIVGTKKAKAFFPICFTLFIFILFNNWFGLVPGVGTIGFWKEAEHGKVLVPLLRAGTADLNLTFALAIIAVISVQFFGFRFLKADYFKKFFNFKSPIDFFIGILELISELAKIISFAFRLFGNIFAGEVLLMVIAFLIPYFAPLPFYGLEIFVGLIQAFVFTMLTVVFLNVATISHQEHEQPRGGELA